MPKNYGIEAIEDLGGIDLIHKKMDEMVRADLVARRLTKKIIRQFESGLGFAEGRIKQILDGSPTSFDELEALSGPLSLSFRDVFVECFLTEQSKEKWNNLDADSLKEIILIILLRQNDSDKLCWVKELAIRSWYGVIQERINNR